MDDSDEDKMLTGNKKHNYQYTRPRLLKGGWRFTNMCRFGSIQYIAGLVLSLTLLADMQIIWALTAPALSLGLYDFTQKRRAVRTTRFQGRMRYILESIRPELRQYFWEADTQMSFPFHETSALWYISAKGILAARPLGTVLDIYQEDYNWLNHSITPTHIENRDFRITVGEGKMPINAPC